MLVDHPRLKLVELELVDLASCIRLIEKTEPDEVYNLAAQTHVGFSFHHPITTVHATGLGPLHFLEAIRNIDLACRYGGEEFVIVMPETDMGVATMVAERLRRRIAGEPFPIQQGTRLIDVTLSIGIAALNGEADNAAAMLKRADQALYRAKRDGRNRVAADAA